MSAPSTNIPSAITELKKSSYGIDNPAYDVGPGGTNPLNPSAGGTPLISIRPSDKPYGDNTKVTTQNNTGSPERKTIIDKNAPNAKKPTTASGDPSIKDLPALIAKVDPQAAGQVLKQMMSALALVNSTMSSNSPTTHNSNVTDGLTGALTILTKMFSYGQVIEAFDLALKNGNFNNITESYKSIVSNSILSLIENAIRYGETNIPTPIVPPIVYGTKIPSPVVTTVPNLYVQQFYTSDVDPYPGYIQWLGPNKDYVYTLRTSSQPPFSNAEDQIIYISQQEIVVALSPFIPTFTLTVNIINEALDNQAKNVQNNHTEATLGNNSSTNLLSLISQILGQLGAAVNLVQSAHLPVSALNVGSVTKTLETFSKNIAMLKMMKSQASGAFQLPSALSSLGSSLPVSSLAVDTSTNSTANVAAILSALTTSGASNTDVLYTKNLLKDINVG